MTDFIKCMASYKDAIARATSPNEVVDLFNRCFLKVHSDGVVEDVDASISILIPQLALERFRNEGWTFKECAGWNKLQARSILEEYEEADKKLWGSSNKQAGKIVMAKAMMQLWDPNLSAPVRLFGFYHHFLPNHCMLPSIDSLRLLDEAIANS